MTAAQVDAFVARLPEGLDPDVRAGVMELVPWLKDPLVSAEVEKMLRLAMAAGSWEAFLESIDTPRTARSGNFGHAGRPGHKGGSAPRGETFLETPKDALTEIAAGNTATIAKEELRGVLELAAKHGGTPDLVLLTLEGTPLFAGGLNIPRKKMPQISTEDRPGLFESLKNDGVSISHEKVAPMSLLPTQSEINASRVGGMLAKFESHHKPIRSILISADNRVLDGHHRWALGVMLQTENDGTKMKVIRIGANHTRALALLNDYTKKHHIAPQALTRAE